MKLFTGLCASLLLVFSSVGCCCLSSCVNSCDPCGRELCGGGFGCGCTGGCGMGGCLSKLFHHRCHKCHPMYAGYGWDAYAGGCGQDVCYSGCGPTYAPAGCACGEPHGPSAPMSMPMTPPTQMPPAQSPPAPIPGVAEPMSARPMRPVIQQAAAPMTQSVQPQQVSYEEFQRLPGSVTAGPTSTPLMVPPVAK